mgnify:FL=1
MPVSGGSKVLLFQGPISHIITTTYIGLGPIFPTNGLFFPDHRLLFPDVWPGFTAERPCLPDAYFRREHFRAASNGQEGFKAQLLCLNRPWKLTKSSFATFPDGGP